MRVDMRQMAAAAARAALENGEPQPRKRSGLRTVAAGAMLAVAARVAVGKAWGVPRIGDLAEMGGQLRGRLADGGPASEEDQHFDDYEFDDDPEDEEETDGQEPRVTPDQEYWERLEALEAGELRE